MICGFAAETLLHQKIKACPKFKPFKLPSSDALIKMALTTNLGRKRLALAQPYLEKEYRLSIQNPDWNCVPAQIILDYVFGIDNIVCFLGYAVAIDVTTNPYAIDEKVTKLQMLKPLWQQLGIDRACICHISQGLPSASLWDSLKQTIKAQQVVPIAVTV